MNKYFPLSLKIISWALLNLLVVAGIFLLIFQLRYGAGLELLFGGNTKKRIIEFTQIVSNELKNKPETEWNSVLKNFEQIYDANLFLFRCNGMQLAGQNISLPSPVIEKLSSIRGGMGQGRGPGRGAMWVSDHEWREPLYFYYHDSERGGYWIGIRLYSIEKFNPQGGGIALLMRINSIFKSSFFDVQPLSLAGGVALIISLLLWIPFLHSLTTTIKNTTKATEKIAEGDFSIRIKTNRNDEIGILARSVNKLAERLEGFVSGQRRFLGDVSHELCSPLARIEMALGILEQKVSNDQLNYINDIRDDISQMTKMIKDLLSYSKIGLKEKEIILRHAQLKPIINEAIRKEMIQGISINTDVPDDLNVLCEPELLERAIANVIRNAIQYAGQSGPIEIKAYQENKNVIITITDNGPGVPPGEEQKIFDPFYRVEQSRSREHGGSGLGLAIVRAAVQACRGTVACSNRSPHGLIITIKLHSGD
jgi:two-component system sensor histidine kinase CpxA